MPELPRLFISYATPDAKLAAAFANFLQLGGDLQAQQVFMTARPSTIATGTPFVEAIRDAIEVAALAIMLLTPAYYESHFCLAELGAIWVRQQNRVPVVVPPVNYADLDGVQLGEQAVRLNSPSGLDEIRDAVSAAMGSHVPTALWNDHKRDFLNRWDTELSDLVSVVEKVPATALAHVEREVSAQATEIADLRETAARLRAYSKKLATQNEELRTRVADAPPPPGLEEDPNAQLIAEAEAAIERARARMTDLPTIVREALFQKYHDGQSLTVGGYADTYNLDNARVHEERGLLKWVEDEEQQVWPRVEHPDVGEADEALARVREVAFDGGSLESRSTAGNWIRPLLRERYGVTDPVFELRPVWEALDLL